MNTAQRIYRMRWSSITTPKGRVIHKIVASGRRTSDNDFGLPLKGWATAAARDYRSESATDEFNEKRWAHARGKPLSAEATLAGWDAPNDTDQPMRLLPDGTILTGSTAGMESGGQLNPSMSKWLMGYPDAWDTCAMKIQKKPRKK